MNPVRSLPSAAVADVIRAQLQLRGTAFAEIAELPVTVNEWRRIARAVGREMDRPVQTTAVGGVHVHAILTDWPADDEERSRAQQHAEELSRGTAATSPPRLFPLN